MSAPLTPKVIDMAGRAVEPADVPEIVGYLRGCLLAQVRPDGSVRPLRFSAKELDHLQKVGRGHRAQATAGVCLAFATDGDEVSVDIEVLFDLGHDAQIVHEVRQGAREAVDPEAGLVDSVTLEVAGVHSVATVESGTLTFSFHNPGHETVEGRIWLPYIMAVSVDHLRSNGSLAPAAPRPLMVALGDSITQGFVAGASAQTWPVLLSQDLGLDLLNQGVAGHIFDEGSLRRVKRLQEAAPRLVTVAYGTNDWARLASPKKIKRRARAYLERVRDLFGATARIYVISPIWRADAARASASGRPLAWVGGVLRQVCEDLGLRFVDGFDLVPHDSAYLGDMRLHPNAEGCRAMAGSLVDRIDEDRLNERAVDPVTGLGTAAAAADVQSLGRDGAPGGHPAFDALVRTIWRLRQDDGCPWDREQTHASIARNMVEEAYEALEAIESGETGPLVEELGDVLMQVVLQAQIAADAGEFDVDDVVAALDEKLVRRHPHVFGDLSAEDPDAVLDIWESVKDGERSQKDAGLLDSVPRSLPSLMECQKISKRAARAGFDWPDTAAVWDKVAEERAEFEAEEPGSEAAAMEFGDLLFALVNVARKEGIDAEAALRASDAKFRRRWAFVEARCAEEGTGPAELSHERLEELWSLAKDGEGASAPGVE